MFILVCCSFLYADEIQDNYAEQISDTRLEIIHKASALKQANVGGSRLEQNITERDFEAIEGKISRLKMDISKYYKGKTPKSLKTEIAKLTHYYYDTKKETYQFIIDLYKR